MRTTASSRKESFGDFVCPSRGNESTSDSQADAKFIGNFLDGAHDGILLGLDFHVPWLALPIIFAV
jgi:hypothetical protein